MLVKGYEENATPGSGLERRLEGGFAFELHLFGFEFDLYAESLHGGGEGHGLIAAEIEELG